MGWWLLGIGAFVLSGWGVLSTFRMLHPKPKFLSTTPVYAPTSTASLVTRDGHAVELWVFEAVASRGIVIACHGYHANRRQLVEIAHGLGQRRYTVVLFDLRGHGTRRGSCTFGTQDSWDIGVILNWINQQPTLRPLPVGLLGLSLGGVIACQATLQYQAIRAVVVDSAYARLFPILARAIRRDYRLPPIPWAWVTWLGTNVALGRCSSHLDPLRVAAGIQRPLLLIHGEDDQSVPVSHAKALYARWQGPKAQWIEPHIGHVGMFAANPALYCTRVADFFDRWLSPAHP